MIRFSGFSLPRNGGSEISTFRNSVVIYKKATSVLPFLHRVSVFIFSYSLVRCALTVFLSIISLRFYVPTAV